MSKPPKINIENTLPKRVQQPTDLTNNFIQYKFSPAENRILVRILQMIKHNQSINFSPQIDIEDNVLLNFDYRDFLLKNHKSKQRVQDALKSLREKSIEVKTIVYDKNGEGHSGTRTIGVIEKPEWDDAKRLVNIRIDKEWYAYLCNLEPGYTSYIAETSFNLSSRYSIKMYMYISNWIKTKKGDYFSLERCIKEFELTGSSYNSGNKASNIKNRVFAIAKKELDRTADVSFNYSVVKIKGKIDGFNLAFYYTDNTFEETDDWKKINELTDTVVKQYNLSLEEKARFIGLTKKHTFIFIQMILSNRSYDIQLIMENGKSLIDAIAIIIHKEFKDNAKMTDSNSQKSLKL